MFEVTVEAGFSSGHYLRNYQGKCENPHGHNYKVFVTLAGAELDEAGLLLDFKLLKQVMRPVVDRLDHQMINDLEPFNEELNPSAENLDPLLLPADRTAAERDDRRPGARQGLHAIRDRHELCPLLRVSGRSADTRPMRLIELYRSVQGESSFAGLPCTFVRLAGCNLRCAWCDSTYTFTGGTAFTQDEILSAVEALRPCKLVEFTGGEPMLQARELIPLMQTLLDRGYMVMIETSGERPLDEVPPAVHKIVDVKCPGAGAAFGSFRMENLATLTSRDEVKFVLTDRADYEFAREFLREHDLNAKAGGILLSPAFRRAPSPVRTADNMSLDPRELVAWMLEDGLDARLSLQIHKFIWEPMRKGV